MRFAAALRKNARMAVERYGPMLKRAQMPLKRAMDERLLYVCQLVCRLGRDRQVRLYISRSRGRSVVCLK